VRGDLWGCSCEDVTQDCPTCRQSWLWDDGVPMTYFGWRNLTKDEPGLEACGRLNAYGWADTKCTYKFKYICEKYIGMFEGSVVKFVAAHTML